jgi:hypothetical protein
VHDLQNPLARFAAEKTINGIHKTVSMHVSRNGDHENDGKQIANASGKDERGQEMDERSQSSYEQADERE